MRILVIGSGGREHALAWRLAQSGHTIASAPGNPGLTSLGPTYPAPDYLAAARHFNAELTVVGPEAPLAAGVVDQFRAEGLLIVGPSQQNARLEASKIYAKQFMVDAGIPTARYIRTETAADALAALPRFPLPVVIKADGLMAGKGVVIAQTRDEAEFAIASLGPHLIVEEFLRGEEVSFIALCDGRSALPLEPTQDHKAIYDNDQGPNTGGMGAYCDSRILPASTTRNILDTVIQPVIDRTGFTGFLYAGLMMTGDGPKVLEFNVRLGDPETQPLMHRLRCDFAEALFAAASGSLHQASLSWSPDPSVCVVLAAHGYPQTPRTGDPITGLELAPAAVFHAGTRFGPSGIVTSGGRVLGVTASGPDLQSAIDQTYAAVSTIHFDGMQFRKDIGRKGLARW